MTRLQACGWSVVAAVLLGCAALAQDVSPGVAAAGVGYANPTNFEKSIRDFEAADRTNTPPSGAIVVAGSSSIRMWHGQMRGDLAPLTVIPRGFGGSTMNDLLYYAPRVIVAYKPRAVVVYEGDNDLARGIAPSNVVAKFTELVALLHRELPAARIYYMACKPSPRRVALWPKAVALNDSIRRLCEQDSLLSYIDVATPLLDAAGQPRAELFGKDRLHMVRAGYEVWAGIVKPALMAREAAFEAAAPPVPGTAAP